MAEGFPPSWNFAEQIRQIGGLAAFHQVEQVQRVILRGSPGRQKTLEDAARALTFPYGAPRNGLQQRTLTNPLEQRFGNGRFESQPTNVPLDRHFTQNDRVGLPIQRQQWRASRT